MLQLTMHGNNEAKSSQLTRDERWSNPLVCGWLCATQVWSFEGDGIEGDAICVTTGHYPYARNMVVLRLGTKIQVLEAQGVAGALNAFGYTTNPEVKAGGNA